MTAQPFRSGGARGAEEIIRLANFQIFEKDLVQLVIVILPVGPDVLNHNLETVPRLYARVLGRRTDSFARSRVLRRSAAWARAAAPMPQAGRSLRAGSMVGLGETADEVAGVLGRLRCGRSRSR